VRERAHARGITRWIVCRDNDGSLSASHQEIEVSKNERKEGSFVTTINLPVSALAANSADVIKQNTTGHPKRAIAFNQISTSLFVSLRMTSPEADWSEKKIQLREFASP
jgi:hypothetical protein